MRWLYDRRDGTEARQHLAELARLDLTYTPDGARRGRVLMRSSGVFWTFRSAGTVIAFMGRNSIAGEASRSIFAATLT